MMHDNLRRCSGLILSICFAAALAVAAWLSAPALAQPAEPTNGPRRIDPGWHALIHAKAVVKPGEVVEDATIVFRDGVFVSIGAGATPPAGARVWDCTGLTVYAGLVEAYAPVDAPKPESTNPGRHWNEHVMAERSALDGAGLDKDARKKLREQGFVAAAIAPKGGVFRGFGAVVMLGEKPDTSDEPAPVLARRAFQTVSIDSPQGGGEDRYPSSKMGAIALVRQTLADGPWHERATEAYNADPSRFERPAPSDTSAALTDPAPLMFDVSHEQDVLRAAKIAREFGRKAIIVGSGTEFRREQAVAGAGLPIILPLAFAEKPEVKTLGERDSVGLREMMAWEAAPTNPARLDKTGIVVALTSSKLPKGQDFFKNLREAILAGLGEERALAMLTTRPAEILGLSRVLGTIEPGKKACLVVVKGSLFEKEREIRDVWVDGVRNEVNARPRVELDGKWKAIFTSEGGAPVEGMLTVAKKNKITFERPTTEADRAREAEEKAKKEAEKQAEPGKDAARPEGGAEQAPAVAEEKKEEKKDDKKDATRKFEARNIALEENRLDFVLDGPALGLPAGPVWLSGIVESTMSGGGTAVGGGAVAWSASREDEGKSDGSKKDEKKDEDDKPDPNRYAGIPESFGLPFGPFALDGVPAQKDMVIRGGTIWTSGPAGIIENGVMIVQSGKVTGVFKAADAPSIKLRDGSLVIDATGKHITPGLIDCHSHTGIMGGVNEGTQSCTAEVRIFDVIDPDSVNWYRELAGGLTAANQLHGSANAIGGQNSVVKLRWGCGSPDDMRIDGAIPGIKFALGENVKQSNWGAQANSRYPQTRMGVETYIVDRFTAGREYAAAWAKWDAMSEADKARGVAPRRDLELEAMAEILAGNRLVHCHSYRQDEILMLCRVAKNFGFKIGTFQHVLEGYKVAEAIREQALGASAFSDWWGYKWEVFDAIPYAGSIMHDAGVVVSFNSDSDELARRMNYEAGKAVKYGGVDRAEALGFVTRNPARQLKLDDRIGSLAAGMDADFAVWSGDPLSTLSRCEATYIDGREYFSLTRDAELRKANDAMRLRIMKKLLDKPGASEKPASEGDRPGGGRRPRGEAPPTADMRGGRGWGLVPVSDGDIEEAHLLAQRHALEEQFHWMIQNGIDPARARCGDCGCSVHAVFAQ